ncbi:MAG: hypothetical protein JNJ88_11840 [Planctomycetes bacterium]|nr:hypothetical protein [Planctomycetota bacterium]
MTFALLLLPTSNLACACSQAAARATTGGIVSIAAQDEWEDKKMQIPGQTNPALLDLGTDLRSTLDLIDSAKGAMGSRSLVQARDTILESSRQLGRCRGQLDAWIATGEPLPESGLVFAIEAESCDYLPGAAGRIELVIGSIVDDHVPVWVRTCDDETIIPSRPLGIGEEIAFGSQSERYRLRVESFLWPWLRLSNPHDVVVLRISREIGSVTKVPTADSPRDQVDLGFRPSLARKQALLAPHAASSQSSTFPWIAQAMEVVSLELSSAEVGIQQLLARLERGVEPSMMSDVEELRRLIVRAAHGITQLAQIRRTVRPYGCTVSDLSLVTAKILSVGTDQGTVKLGVRNVLRRGARFASRSKLGRRFPSLDDQDVQGGAILEVKNVRLDTGIPAPKEDMEYLIALTPPVELSLWSRESGARGEPRIMFAIRLSRPR